MSAPKRIAIDVMGGDFGPSVAVPAAIRALATYQDLSVVLVGDEPQIKALMQQAGVSSTSRLELLHTAVSVHNDSKPESVLRNSRESSMFLAVNLVKEGRVDACVSAGNTGALLLSGRHLLKNIPGISKPAMIASVPLRGVGSKAYILDVGANVSNDAAELFEFAVMGSIQAESVDRISAPRVALLNVGHEEHKGTPTIRETATHLAQTTSLNYIGYIEGNELFSGKADVIVCDGFSGNITIKTSAGVVRVIEQVLKSTAEKGLLSRLLLLLAAPLLRRLRREIDPAQFNGASVIGLQGIIVKSHGHAHADAFYHAIAQAYREASDCVPEKIATRMASLVQAPMAQNSN
ncbi:MAG: phosphate acyltransferase PlsX [Pseudomonadales bacterium]|nr:phosphate acyltransferase PlsX [Pseudomonadales bacterium]